MKHEIATNTSKRTAWAVRILTTLVILPFGMSAIMKLMHLPRWWQGLPASGSRNPPSRFSDCRVVLPGTLSDPREPRSSGHCCSPGIWAARYWANLIGGNGFHPRFRGRAVRLDRRMSSGPRVPDTAPPS